MPILEMIRDEDLERACSFMQRHLNPNFSMETWKSAFLHPWDPEKPNNGFMSVEENGAIVAVLGAIYARREIRGRMERFCCPTSWMVLPEYRGKNTGLMRALLNQPGFHFFAPTPNPTVVAVYQRNQFTTVDPRQIALFNPPMLAGRWEVVTDPDGLERLLSPVDRTLWRDHRSIPWMHHLAVGEGSRWCYVAWKMRRWKRHPSPLLMHVSDAELFLRGRWALGNHLRRTLGAWSMRVERRFLGCNPILSMELIDPQPKLFLSPSLGEADFLNLYSENVALDI